MRCNCRDCIENEDGYCSCPSYVTIFRNGGCETATVVSAVDLTEQEENNGELH